MPRTIPIALAPQVAIGASSTRCALLKITPVQPGYAPFGVTSLDRDVTYDDGSGDGPILYSASVGNDVSSLTSASDLSVAGGESKHLIPVFDTPLTEAQIHAGACDYAKFIGYEINYKDTTSGHHIVLQSGTLGQNSLTDSGRSWVSELRGLTQSLKQTITEKWSLTCRAVFGSTVSSAQSRYPCNFDLTPLWHSSTVGVVGIDPTYSFSCLASDITAVYGGAPGMIEWLTGANAGRSDETESFEVVPLSSILIIGLEFGASYPIQVGDTFRFRDDCPKTPLACQARSNYQNYRGEPSIPVADNGAMAVGNIGGAVTTTTGD